MRYNYYKSHVLCLVAQSHVWLFVTTWTAARQAPLFMGIRQARILEWTAMPSSRGSSKPRDRTQVSRITGRFFTTWAPRLLQSCLTLCNPMDYSLPGSSVHGISQARILEWVAVSSSRGTFQPRNQTCVSYVSCIDRQVFSFFCVFFLTISTTQEAPFLNRRDLKSFISYHLFL